MNYKSMSVNERFKHLRKNILNKTQLEFAKVLDMSHAGISKIESGKTTLTEKNIKIICKEFNVSYAWLVDGVGDIFINSDTSLLEYLTKEYDLDETESDLIESFLKLDDHDRKLLLNYVKNVFVPSLKKDE